MLNDIDYKSLFSGLFFYFILLLVISILFATVDHFFNFENDGLSVQVLLEILKFLSLAAAGYVTAKGAYDFPVYPNVISLAIAVFLIGGVVSFYHFIFLDLDILMQALNIKLVGSLIAGVLINILACCLGGYIFTKRLERKSA